MAPRPGLSERPKRFYTAVDIRREEGGHVVTLDGRAMRTPAGAALEVPTPALASLIAAEWSAQGEFIDFAEMFATRLAYAVIDSLRARRAAAVEDMVAYAGSDLLCYFAERPESLFEEETERWGPVLDWAERALGLRFARVVGMVHQTQPAETLAGVRALAEGLGDFILGGLNQAAGLFGSTVLALALQRGELDAEAAFELSRLDEAFQERLWGVDEEAALRTFNLRSEANALGRWFQALR